MINCIIGTMKASKSKTLIEYTEMFKDKNYIVLYPSICEKSDGYVFTRHQNKKVKAKKIFEIKDLYTFSEDRDIIFVDEFQFMVNSGEIDSFMEYLEWCDTQNKTVYLFGLQLDYLSNSFEITQRVLPYCDTLIMMYANCDHCGAQNKGVRCIRYIDGELDLNPNSQLLVMENSNVEYKTVCKKCYRQITGEPAIK